MADDVKCPNLHDGMAVIDAEGSSGRIILDELIRSTSGARDHLVRLEEMSDDELDRLQEEFGSAPTSAISSIRDIGCLLMNLRSRLPHAAGEMPASSD